MDQSIEFPLKSFANHPAKDLSLPSIFQAANVGSFFETIVKVALKSYEAVVPNCFTSLKIALFETLNNKSKIMQLAQTHKSLLLELYEDLGAGLSYGPSSHDKPTRLEFTNESEMSSLWQKVMVKATEKVEMGYDFASEIRAEKLAEKERNMREFEDRIRRLKQKQAEYQA